MQLKIDNLSTRPQINRVKYDAVDCVRDQVVSYIRGKVSDTTLISIWINVDGPLRTQTVIKLNKYVHNPNRDMVAK